MKDFKNIKVISFDLDDTLWECSTVIQNAEEKLYQWLSMHYPRVTQHFSQKDLKEQRKIVQIQYPHIKHDVSAIRKRSFEMIFERANYSKHLSQSAFDYFLYERNKVTLFPEVLPVLNILIKTYQLVAITNGNACVYKAGLGYLFCLSLNPSHVGTDKPNKAIFEHVYQSLNIKPQQMLHIGDNPIADVHGARETGARVIWMNRYKMAWDESVEIAEWEIKDLAALLEILPRI